MNNSKGHLQILANLAVKRLFQGIVVLFFATPFLLLLYFNMAGQANGIDLMEILKDSPRLNIVFVSLFATPFMGYWMIQEKNRLVSGGQLESFVTKMLICFISLLLMGNTTYAFLLVILCYFIFKEESCTFRTIINFYKGVNFQWTEWRSAITMLLMSCLIRGMLIMVG